ncbi:hypothetical protein K2173_023557 [Erythroxylum novogranatense]|uniref:Uncharacterized protein n=1 Tax=Erythroxylum novogranatense TaxID=1862640 RepID=A0AAV8TR20_9ROSI|nr:hypothetical protein K2173_023557 [Erythroxylum novogranatense]
MDRGTMDQWCSAGMGQEFWITKGLSFLASSLGKPLYMDSQTATMERIYYAKVGFSTEVSAKGEQGANDIAEVDDVTSEIEPLPHMVNEVVQV